ncbi:MAG: alpha/beta hydrolase [Rhodocyclaceae bacterium]|nr:alpha/beta hydrolase [Rhodocyclaceae bacterium]
MTIEVRTTLLAIAISILAVVGTLRVAIAGGESAASTTIGVAIMHGKGGLPTRHVADLETFLAERHFLVANLEMPWSGRRDYDVDVATAEAELSAALETLRAKGAKKLFVAGHSQGGMFALYFAGRNPVDGAIAIAPGGYADGPLTRQKLAESVDAARQLILAGKASEKARLLDFEGAKGTYPIIVKPDIYLTWFDPDGTMTTATAIKKMSAQTQVLFIVPTNDHPGLLKVKQSLFDALPKHPRSRLYEPNADHLGAPSASREEIARWIHEIASSTQ